MSRRRTIGQRLSRLNLRSDVPSAKPRRMSKSPGNSRMEALSQQEIRDAIEEIVKIAKSERVAIALIGGCALQLYGSTRFTADIDFASDNLIDDLPRGTALSFGGEQTHASNGVTVDLIIRDDRWAPLYEAAIETAKRVPGTKAPVARPEYLLAMKMQARRPKDEADIDFLLRSGVVNLKRAKKIVEEYLGGYAEEELEALADEIAWKESRGK